MDIHFRALRLDHFDIDYQQEHEQGLADMKGGRSSNWNWDYTNDTNNVREAYYTHPPCLCGEISPAPGLI